jgi:hypothetical protein
MTAPLRRDIRGVSGTESTVDAVVLSKAAKLKASGSDALDESGLRTLRATLMARPEGTTPPHDRERRDQPQDAAADAPDRTLLR